MTQIVMGCSKITLFTAVMAIILVGTYPTSPVLHQLLIFSPKAVFVLLSIFIIYFLLKIVSNSPSEKIEGLTKKLTKLLLITFIFLLYKIIFDDSLIAVRDLLVVIIALILLSINLRFLILIQGKICNIIAIIITIAFIPVILINLEIIDILSWHVLDLQWLSLKNTIFAKQASGDHEYFMPLYLAVIPLDLNVHEIMSGIAFNRQPLIFTEWTYTWYFLAPITLYTFGRGGMRYKKFTITLFLLALVMGLSVWGLIISLASIIFSKILRMMKSKALPIIILSITLLFGVFNAQDFLEILGGNKLDQYWYFSETIDLDAHLSLSGVAGDPRVIIDGHKSYGSLYILISYGIIGATLYLSMVMIYLMAIFNVLTLQEDSIRSIKYTAVAVLISIFIGFKVPYFINLLQALLGIILIKQCDYLAKNKGAASPSF